jgi:hypothetical protein
MDNVTGADPCRIVVVVKAFVERDAAFRLAW